MPRCVLYFLFWHSALEKVTMIYGDTESCAIGDGHIIAEFGADSKSPATDKKSMYYKHALNSLLTTICYKTL